MAFFCITPICNANKIFNVLYECLGIEEFNDEGKKKQRIIISICAIYAQPPVPLTQLSQFPFAYKQNFHIIFFVSKIKLQLSVYMCSTMCVYVFAAGGCLFIHVAKNCNKRRKNILCKRLEGAMLLLVKKKKTNKIIII